jgi:hypothetical protein
MRLVAATLRTGRSGRPRRHGVRAGKLESKARRGADKTARNADLLDDARAEVDKARSATEVGTR